MDDHDSVKQLNDFLGNEDLIRKISPKFSELSLDIREISNQCKDPMFLAVLIFKLAQEREKTNKVLEQVLDRFDTIMQRLKATDAPTAHMQSHEPQKAIAMEKAAPAVLPEHDQMIMLLAQSHGQITAEDVKAELGYKGKNAASQRLNRLFRDGHLRKMQSGRKTFYLAKA